jgi:hypothetical protein
MEFKISGIVREKETLWPIPGLLVRAFDKDLLFTDVLGNAITDHNGRFVLGYERRDFRELFERKPDVYLEIYGSATALDPGRPGDRPIYSTRDAVRFNAGRHEFFMIEIPHDQLGEDAPTNGVHTTPDPGDWKPEIDEYIQDHPLDYQYDPDKGFMSPQFDCTSNFGPEIRNLNVGDAGIVTVSVTNRGNGISFNAHVEAYEGPGGYSHLLRHYRLCDSRTLTICPGQTVDVRLNWNRLLDKGRCVGICFDPFLDPRGFSLVEQYNPHITSIHYGYSS